jgi:hypothetical protein
MGQIGLCDLAGLMSGPPISLVLRLPDPIPADKRLLMVIEEFQGIGGSKTIASGEDQVRPLPDGVAAALRRDLHSRDV